MLFAVFVLMLTQNVNAQTRTVTGTITDATTNEPLPGVTVIIKNTTTGTSTGISGDYSIDAASGQVLVFSSIGYVSQEVTVGASDRIDIRLVSDVEIIDEVVVVGYGSQKRANLTGAVSTVDVSKTLEARPIADAGRGLQGTMPGLSVVIPSGELGSDPVMNIRGQIGSYRGGASPLILVDNVEIPSIQMLNPDDIASISILKDAASSSIYGSKAAFGVILITTKKGATVPGVNVTYSGNVSVANISRKMEMGGIDAIEYSLLAAERENKTLSGAFWMYTHEGYEKALEWQDKWADVVDPEDPMLFGRDWYVDVNGNKIGLRTYDPYDYMIREWAPTHQHNLSVNGKSGQTDYNLSFGYLDQQGINKPAKIDDFKRYNGSLHVGTNVTEKIRVYAGAMYSKRNKRYAYATSSTTADPWLYLYRWGPTYPMTTEDGDPIRSPRSEMAAANTAFQQYNYTSVNGGFEITPVKDWVIKFDYTHANQEYITKRPGTRYTARNSWTSALPKYDDNGNRIYVNDSGVEVPSTTTGAMAAYELSYDTYTAVGSNPDHVYRYVKNDQWNTLNLSTNYDLKVGNDNLFNFLLGVNRTGYTNAYNWSQTTQLVDYNNPQFDLAVGTQTTSGGEDWESQLGFYGRVNYSFKDKYLLEGNLRYDGTSKFPPALKWRWFPSFSAGWRLSEESWMSWSRPFLNSLKIRGSWGTIGDQSVPNSLYIPTMTGSQANWIISGAKLYQFATPGAVSGSVTWQDITTLDFGFDARFLQRKIGVTFDWFTRDTRNMIVPQEGLPTTFGTTAPQSNYGSLRTKGIELQVDFNHRFDNGLGIGVTATLSDAVTTITEYGSTKSIDNWYVGKTYGEIWGYETDRLYQVDDFQYDNEDNFITGTSADNYTINLLSDPNAATQGRLQSGNLVFGPGDVKFVDLNGDGIISPGNKLIEDADGNPDHGDLTVIGNSTPRYLYGFRTDLDYKGIDLSIFIQGVGKREVWGSGFLAIPGYNPSNGAMPQEFAGNFWREDRTDAFYPRPASLGQSAIFNMVPQTRYLLNMAYLRLKNITLGYTLPSSLTKKVNISKARVYIALENFLTFDHLGTLPIDPEEIEGFSMWNSTNYNLSRTGVGVPTFKNASAGLQINF